MLVQEHIRQLVNLAMPPILIDYNQPDPVGDMIQRIKQEQKRLQSQITPIKFGNTALWLAAAVYRLAEYQVPRNADYNIVMRVETYTVNLTSGAADYGSYQPPPPGSAYWEITPAGTGTARIVTDEQMQSHVMLDCDEFKIFPQGEYISLMGDFLVSPDAVTRHVRTLVYSYNVTAEIVERLGGLAIVEPPSVGV